MGYTQFYTQKEEAFFTAYFGGDVKLLIQGSWLILVNCTIPACSLAKHGKKTLEITITAHVTTFVHNRS